MAQHLRLRSSADRHRILDASASFLAARIWLTKGNAAEILRDALALPTDARAALAAALLDSVDRHVDEDAEAAWVTEINRRVAASRAERCERFPGQECGAGRSCARNRFG